MFKSCAGCLSRGFSREESFFQRLLRSCWAQRKPGYSRHGEVNFQPCLPRSRGNDWLRPVGKEQPIALTKLVDLTPIRPDWKPHGQPSSSNIGVVQVESRTALLRLSPGSQ